MVNQSNGIVDVQKIPGFCAAPEKSNGVRCGEHLLAQLPRQLFLQARAIDREKPDHGGAYVASITLVSKKHVSAEVKVFLPEEVELPFSLTLAQVA